MTPERRAEVVAALRRHDCAYGPNALAMLREAADALEIKLSESSGEAPPGVVRVSRRWIVDAIDERLAYASPSLQPDSLMRAEILRLRADLLTAPKPSESSMVQRIEADVRAALVAFNAMIIDMGSSAAGYAWRVQAVRESLERALFGPPDLERDREQSGEAERP